MLKKIPFFGSHVIRARNSCHTRARDRTAVIHAQISVIRARMSVIRAHGGKLRAYDRVLSVIRAHIQTEVCHTRAEKNWSVINARKSASTAPPPRHRRPPASHERRPRPAIYLAGLVRHPRQKRGANLPAICAMGASWVRFRPGCAHGSDWGKIGGR